MKGIFSDLLRTFFTCSLTCCGRLVNLYFEIFFWWLWLEWRGQAWLAGIGMRHNKVLRLKKPQYLFCVCACTGLHQLAKVCVWNFTNYCSPIELFFSILCHSTDSLFVGLGHSCWFVYYLLVDTTDILIRSLPWEAKLLWCGLCDFILCLTNFSFVCLEYYEL